MLNSDCQYLDNLRIKYADLIARNKNKRVKDIELNNMIDRVKSPQSGENEDENDEITVKHFEQQQYEAPKTFKQHLVMQRANIVPMVTQQEKSPEPVHDMIRQESTPNEAINYYHYGNSIKKSPLLGSASGSKDSGSNARPYQSYLVN
jgi:hypothetical protein